MDVFAPLLFVIAMVLLVLWRMSAVKQEAKTRGPAAPGARGTQEPPGPPASTLPHPTTLGPPRPPGWRNNPESPRPPAGQRASKSLSGKALMPVIISLVLLAAALYIILAPGYGDEHQKWAFGTVGTLIGFWLKP